MPKSKSSKRSARAPTKAKIGSTLMSILSKSRKSKSQKKQTKTKTKKHKWSTNLGLNIPGYGGGTFGITSDRRRGKASEFMTTSVPSSFNTVVNNPANMSAERPVTHKQLGLQGIRITGSQYFCQLHAGVLEGTVPKDGLIVDGSFYGEYLPQFSTVDDNKTTIGGIFPFNPLNLGGPVTDKAIRYQRWRCNSATLRMVNSCGTSQPGTVLFGYYKDFAVANTEYTAELNFRALSDLVPSTAFPVTIPTASCTFVYDGPELYYMGHHLGRPYRQTDDIATPTTWGDAQNRQEQQGAWAIVCDTVNPGTTPGPNYGHVYLDYDFEFYDPWPAASYAPITLNEHMLVRDLLSAVRAPKQPEVWCTPGRDAASDLDAVLVNATSASDPSATSPSPSPSSSSSAADASASAAHAVRYNPSPMDLLIRKLVSVRMASGVAPVTQQLPGGNRPP